jgi:hypothetical protein
MDTQIIGEWMALRLCHAGTASCSPRLIVGCLRVPALDGQFPKRLLFFPL